MIEDEQFSPHKSNLSLTRNDLNKLDNGSTHPRSQQGATRDATPSERCTSSAPSVRQESKLKQQLRVRDEIWHPHQRVRIRSEPVVQLLDA
jgi:hypothetical protein